MQHVEVEYVPNRQRRLGLRIWKEMALELHAARGLIWQLCRRDVAARYKQSVLGVAWALLVPLGMMLVFVLLNRARVLPIGATPVPYPLFAYFGLLVWQLFARTLVLATQAVVANLSILSQIKAPGEAFVLASAGQAVFEFGMGLVVLGGMFAWFGVAPPWTVVLLPWLLAVIVAAALGLGLLLGLANAAVRDVGNMLPMLTTLWMLATPVVYPAPQSWPWALVGVVNPLGPLIEAARALAFTGALPLDPLLAAATIFALCALLVGWRLFHLLEPKIAERL